MDKFWGAIGRVFSGSDAMNVEIPFVFDSNPTRLEHAYWAKLTEGVSSKDQLLDCLYRLLSFPGYFGFNWDALSDCLTDFQWVEQKEIVLVHGELPSLEEPDLIIYLQILWDAVLDWESLDQHCFKVIFPVEDQGQIRRLLKGYESVGRRAAVLGPMASIPQKQDRPKLPQIVCPCR